MIPKIIHYCWFGDTTLPDEYSQYINEWKSLHPGWEIRRWDERNAPLTHAYLANACKLSNWSNCSNFIRLWALYEYGGVYLDTDFKLIKPLDPLQKEDAFLGFEQGPESEGGILVNNAIVGAEKQHSFIKDCFDYLISNYDGSEQSDLSGPQLTTTILKTKWGLSDYGLIHLHLVTIYPVEYFYPVHVHQAYLLNRYSDYIKEETYGIHMWRRSWVSQKDLLDIVNYLNYKALNQDVYIRKLESDLAVEKKNTDEIWFWKTHYEEKYKLIESQQEHLEAFWSKINSTLDQVTGVSEMIHNQKVTSEKLTSSIKDTLDLFLEKRMKLTEELSNLITTIQSFADTGGYQHQEIGRLSNELNEARNNLQIAVQKTVTLEKLKSELEAELIQRNKMMEESVQTCKVQLHQLEKELIVSKNISAAETVQWLSKEERWREIQFQKSLELQQMKNELAAATVAVQHAKNELGNVQGIITEMQTRYNALLYTFQNETLKDFLFRKYFKKTNQSSQ